MPCNSEKAEKVTVSRVGPQPPAGTPEHAAFVEKTRKEDAERRRVLARHERCITAVDDLERRLDIDLRWLPNSEEWREAEKLSREYRYRKALDKLQVLIVGRLLELSKANMVETGQSSRLNPFFSPSTY